MNTCVCPSYTVLKRGLLGRGRTSAILYALAHVGMEIYTPLPLKPLLSPLHPPEGPGRGRESVAAQIVILIASPPWCLTSCQFFCNSARDCPFLSPYPHWPFAPTWTVSIASEQVFPEPSPSFSSPSTLTQAWICKMTLTLQPWSRHTPHRKS